MKWERFRVFEQLRAGAFGRSLLVMDSARADREVVITVPDDKQTEKALIYEPINATAITANLVGLSHPNIGHCIGFDLFDEYYVMIVEYVQGREVE